MGILAYGLIALAVMGMIGTGVYKVKQWGGDEVRAEWTAANEKARAEQEAKSTAAAAELEKARNSRRIVREQVVQYVDREVEKTVYRSDCLPASGVCIANAVLAGEKPTSCLIDGAVPPAKPPG